MKLFEPKNIGGVQLRNRLVMLPMAVHLGTNNRVNEMVKAFYAERALGGVGLIEVGVLNIVDPGEAMSNQISIHSDDLVPGLKELVSTVHTNGAKIFAQIGPQRHWRRDEGAPLELIGPSGVTTRSGDQLRELTIGEIQLIIKQFAQGAKRAKLAGFDGIEIQAAVGYLLSQFISPLTNQRDDDYGGNMENRLRFPLDVVAAVKNEMGEEYPIIIKISGDDFVQGGSTLEDMKMVASVLEESGVNALSIAAGWHESPVPMAVNMVPQGGFAYLAEGIKSVVSIPVMATYRIVDPMIAEDILAQGKADLVGMARALLADPDLPNKAEGGHFDEIRPCIACCRCLDLAFRNLTPRCSVNPRMGKEAEYLIEPATTKKKVLVIGGGPAGMEAARIAAKRGHTVTLFEKCDQLGGQLSVAAAAPFKNEIVPFGTYLIRQIEKSGVNLKLNNEATVNAIAHENPDEVIIATGSLALTPNIPGIDSDNVITAVEIMKGKKDTNQRVVVIGGGMIGCEVAELLLNKGKEVTVLEMASRVGQDIGATNRWVSIQRLKKAGCRMETNTEVIQISKNGVEVEREGEKEYFPADTIVLAVGLMANNDLVNKLEKNVTSIHVIGDALEPRRIMEAVEEGFLIGSRI